MAALDFIQNPKRTILASCHRFFAHMRILVFYENLGLCPVFGAQQNLYNFELQYCGFVPQIISKP